MPDIVVAKNVCWLNEQTDIVDAMDLKSSLNYSCVNAYMWPDKKANIVVPLYSELSRLHVEYCV